jgi:hypothetical protein
VTEEDDPISPEEEANFRADLALVLSVVATFVVYRLPNADTIGWPLVLLSTFAHELGHGVAALLVGGSFHSLLISPDASGVAHCMAEGNVRHAIVSAGGLVGPACVAAIFFALARHEKLARISLVLLGLGIVGLVPTLLEGTFGKVFASVLAVLFLAVGVRAPAWLSRHALAFVAVQLALSVWSRGDYLFTRVAHMATGDMPSDVANMERYLGLDYRFWGAVCAAFSVVALIVGARLFLRGLPLPGPRRAKPEPAKEPPRASNGPQGAL